MNAKYAIPRCAALAFAVAGLMFAGAASAEDKMKPEGATQDKMKPDAMKTDAMKPDAMKSGSDAMKGDAMKSGRMGGDAMGGEKN